MSDGSPNTDDAIGNAPTKKPRRHSNYDPMDELILSRGLTERLVSAWSDQAAERMLMVDVPHRWREANQAARALLGLEKSRIDRQPLRQVLPPGVDAEEVHRALSGLTQTPADFSWFETSGAVRHMTLEVRRLSP